MANTLKGPVENDKIQNKKSYRLNLALNPEAKDELELMRQKTGKSSLVDVLRAALAVYKIIVDHQSEGGRVVFRHADNSEETLRFV